MAWLGHLNANFKIGTRIGAGFFLILGLLLTVATGGYLGLRNSLTGFEAYERTAHNSTLVAEADRNFLAMRLNVQMFLQAADDKLVARVRELGKLATDAYKEVDANSVTRERREMVEQVIGQLDQYLQNFEKVAKNQVIIDHEINETTIPLANKLRDSIKGLAQMVANGEDDVTALEASKAMENLLSARVNALLNNQKRAPKLVEMARGQLAALGTSLKLMRQIATQPARQEKAQAAVDALPPYVAAFEKVQTLIGERDKLLELETKIGTEMIATRAKLKAAQEHSLTEKMTATAAAISSSSTLCLSVAGAALALGLALAWFISRGITRPILSLKSAMDAISHGKLDLEVDGAGRKDEIGEMAEAVLVFRDAGREKARLEAAAEKHRETAKNERMRNEAARHEAARQASLVVEGLGRGLERLAKGDLTYRLDDNWAAEYKKIQEDFNGAIAQLQDTIKNIAQSSTEVSNAASEISAATTDLSQRTEEQAASLEETSASMEQISATVKKNADSAKQANDLTQTTREIADRGGAVVADAVSAMARIEESSRKISDIISVIDEIARQTNLLALNAAVEAARAGEAGRGFAVVASEVRSLAQRSSQAAKDIKDLIVSSSGQVRDGVALVNKAGASLGEIVASIKSVADIVAEIANASAEQASGIDQINAALNKMDEVTQQNSALVEENAATAKTLEEQQTAMTERVGFFRVEAEAAAQPLRRAS
ncbi:MAG TPA: methyl-accepting chemotaxis protein [Pseudolabrys sp.]|nr:methyl-accepting chemotaxis protein [Pseudolabrys sp.]